MKQSIGAPQKFYEETSIFDIDEFCRKNNACVDFRDDLQNGFNFAIFNEPSGYATQKKDTVKHSGTQAVLNAIDPKYRTFLEDRKRVLKVTSKKAEVVGEIRGYLAALRIAKIISDLDFRLLLTYYTLDRYKENL